MGINSYEYCYTIDRSIPEKEWEANTCNMIVKNFGGTNMQIDDVELIKNF